MLVSLNDTARIGAFIIELSAPVVIDNANSIPAVEDTSKLEQGYVSDGLPLLRVFVGYGGHILVSVPISILIVVGFCGGRSVD